MIRDRKFRHEQLQKPDFLETTMLPDSQGAGHAVRNHVGKSIPELIDRKLSLNRDGESRSACSSFHDHEAFRKNIINCILKNERKLDECLDTYPNGKIIKLHYKIPRKADWGDTVYENKEKGTLEHGISNDLVLLLKKDSTRNMGFSILTAYCDIIGLQETKPDLTKEVRQTKAWKNASMPRKLLLQRMAEPDPQYGLYHDGGKRLHILDRRSRLRCDFTEKGAYVSIADENGDPKPHGLRKDKENPFVPLRVQSLQKHLQDKHPGFLRDIQGMERTYRMAIPLPAEPSATKQAERKAEEIEQDNKKNPSYDGPAY